MFHRLYADVYSWSEIHGKPGKTYNWNSYAVHIAPANVLALVDPLPLTAEEIRMLEELGPPTHILLTCNWHLRESESCQKRWGCKIYINELGMNEAEFPIDGTFKHGDLLWNTIETIHISDVAWSEETAFLVKQNQGILIMGDALCGGRVDIGVLDDEIGIYPNQMKNISDIQKARKSISQLMEYSFESTCFGHGSPILYQAKEAFQRFIERKDIWGGAKN